MKKNLVALIALVGCINFTKAQGDLTFGLQAGYLNTQSNIKADGLSGMSSNSKPGFKVGVNLNKPLTNALSFNPEINFISKGGKNSFTEMGVTITNNFSANFLEIPLNFRYSLGQEENQGFFLGAGPVVSMGLGGKGTLTAPLLGTINYDIKFDGKKDADLPPTDENAHFKRLELGGNFFAGYQLSNGLNFRLNYNLGFTNLDPNPDGTTRTSYFGLTVGFSFLK